jgi:cyclin-dependent kinase 7
MERYCRGQLIGKGSHAEVFAATRKRKEVDEKEEVVLKRFHKPAANTGLLSMEATREVKFMGELGNERQHPNVMTILDAFFHKDDFYTVLERMSDSLDKCGPLPMERIRPYAAMLLGALAHCHAHWVLHRDVTPSNCLLDASGNVLKLSDFGLARTFGSPDKRMTPVVCTLWYRAPELLMGETFYASGIDMWSAGCVLAEVALGAPLFKTTTSSELDMLHAIFTVLGAPTEETWPGVTHHYALPEFKSLDGAAPTFDATFADVDPAFVRLLRGLLRYDPATRLSAADALACDFFCC